MQRPPLQISSRGICLPVVHDSYRDGDTDVYRVAGGNWTISYAIAGSDDIVVAEFPGGLFRWAVRFLDCWTPEKRECGGMQAKAYLRSLVEKYADRDQSIWIPKPEGEENALAKMATFDRVLAYIFVSPRVTLNGLMVESGWAAETKPALQELQASRHFERMVAEHPELAPPAKKKKRR